MAVTKQALNGHPVAQVVISPPRFAVAEFRIVGTAPYVQARFSEKAKQKMRATQEAGQQGKKGKAREPRDFAADYDGALHRDVAGRFGIPANAFRNACISACRLVGYKMTLAKLSIFAEADGFDVADGTPLVHIDGEPEMAVHAMRNDNGGTDLRVRGMWREWAATVRLRYDADQFSLADVANLLARVGIQVGIGEGRPDSRMSAGMGWGMFRIASE